MDTGHLIGTYVVLATFLFFVGTVNGIRCYQCISTNNTHPFQCNEILTDDIDIEPESCDDVFGAQYCVKHIGRFEAELECYQCTSMEERDCMNGELIVNSSKPKNCSHVFEARYCIKSIGLFGGGIGTKRYCSALDMGNYCDYVKQQGDKLTYRTCIFTCNSDGCNPAASLQPNRNIWPLSLGILLAGLFLR